MSLRRAIPFVGLAVCLYACGADPEPAGTPAPERLGIAEADAERYALDAVTSGQPYGWVASGGHAFKALGDDDRADVIEALAGWAQRFAESDAFRAAYAEQRAASEPQPPTYPESIEQQIERRTQEGLEQIEQSRRDVVPMLPEADRATLLENLEAMAAQLRDPQFTKLQRQGLEMERAADASYYDRAHARWQEEMPEDPNELIKRHLQTFIDTCGSVDFDAELVESYGRMRFADVAYENQSWEWKACFRAGEPSVSAALDAAQDWLEALD